MLSKRLKDVHRFLRSIDSFSNKQASIVDWDSNNLRWIKIRLIPDGGPYSGGEFIFEINLGKSYPTSPPEVTCLTPIYHPNIDAESENNVCVSILDEWQESNGMEDLVQGLLFLIHNPNMEDPLSPWFCGPDFEESQFLTTVRKTLQGGMFFGVRFPKMIAEDVCPMIEKTVNSLVNDALENALDQGTSAEGFSADSSVSCNDLIENKSSDSATNHNTLAATFSDDSHSTDGFKAIEHDLNIDPANTSQNIASINTVNSPQTSSFNAPVSFQPSVAYQNSLSSDTSIENQSPCHSSITMDSLEIRDNNHVDAELICDAKDRQTSSVSTECKDFCMDSNDFESKQTERENSTTDICSANSLFKTSGEILECPTTSNGLTNLEKRKENSEISNLESIEHNDIEKTSDDIEELDKEKNIEIEDSAINKKDDVGDDFDKSESVVKIVSEKSEGFSLESENDIEERNVNANRGEETSSWQQLENSDSENVVAESCSVEDESVRKEESNDDNVVSGDSNAIEMGEKEHQSLCDEVRQLTELVDDILKKAKTEQDGNRIEELLQEIQNVLAKVIPVLEEHSTQLQQQQQQRQSLSVPELIQHVEAMLENIEENEEVEETESEFDDDEEEEDYSSYEDEDEFSDDEESSNEEKQTALRRKIGSLFYGIVTNCTLLASHFVDFTVLFDF